MTNIQRATYAGIDLSRSLDPKVGYMDNFTGVSPSYGLFEVTDTQLKQIISKLPDSGDAELIFIGQEKVTLKKIHFIRATPKERSTAKEPVRYLIYLADRRIKFQNSMIAMRRNILTENKQDLETGTGPDTWQDVSDLFCEALSISALALPFAPQERPQNRVYDYLSGPQPFESFLDEISCFLSYDQETDTFSIFKYGDSDIVVQALIKKLNGRVINGGIEDNFNISPQNVNVVFPLYDPDMLPGWRNIDDRYNIVARATGIPGAIGDISIHVGDFYAIRNGAIITNSINLFNIADERKRDFISRLTTREIYGIKGNIKIPVTGGVSRITRILNQRRVATIITLFDNKIRNRSEEIFKSNFEDTRSIEIQRSKSGFNFFESNPTFAAGKAFQPPQRVNHQPGIVTAGNPITLPGGKTYEVGTGKLWLYENGQLLTIGEDYTEVSETEVALTFDTFSTTKLIYIIWEEHPTRINGISDGTTTITVPPYKLDSEGRYGWLHWEGQLQTPGASHDYIETSTTQLDLNFTPNVGEKYTFIILQTP